MNNRLEVKSKKAGKAGVSRLDEIGKEKAIIPSWKSKNEAFFFIFTF
jgi:hypothetical protein